MGRRYGNCSTTGVVPFFAENGKFFDISEIVISEMGFARGLLHPASGGDGEGGPLPPSCPRVHAWRRRGHSPPPGAALPKSPAIRAPLHPLQLRCASSPYSPGTPSLARLAGAAHRRSRCVRLFARRYTRTPRVHTH